AYGVCGDRVGLNVGGQQVEERQKRGDRDSLVLLVEYTGLCLSPESAWRCAGVCRVKIALYRDLLANARWLNLILLVGVLLLAVALIANGVFRRNGVLHVVPIAVTQE